MTNTITSHAIDFIGDIHGHADELEKLLEEELDYEKTNGFYQHATRKAFFVGDFIDRGPQIREVLEIVKPMIDNGAAHAVIGNHEYNAICYWTQGNKGKYLREHNEKNEGQHKKTIDAFPNTDLLMEYVEWFKAIPIYYEHQNFRVIHAQWSQEHIGHLRNEGITSFNNRDFLLNSGTKGTAEYNTIECLLKGEERDLKGPSFKDKDGHTRYSCRLKWWLQGSNLDFRSSLFDFPDELPNGNLSEPSRGYALNETPVFFGHYWLKNSEPERQERNVCCLDYSVAKEGALVAYRWDGEHKLTNDKFAYVKSRDFKEPKK